MSEHKHKVEREVRCLVIYVNVHDQKGVNVNDFHDGKAPEFSVVEIVTSEGDRVDIHFEDLDSIIGWAEAIKKTAIQMQQEQKKSK